MTLHEPVSSRQILVEKTYPMFIEWLRGKDEDILFLPKGIAEQEKYAGYTMEQKVYVLMKRLRQDYNTIMQMSTEERDMYFRMEMDLIEKENNEADSSNNQTFS